MTGTVFASSVRKSLAMAALVAGTVASLPASAQQPSKAETDAVRSNCRSDYMAKCMSVKPGGIEAIECLKKNDASLSPACRSAVSAIKLPGEAAPPAATPAPSPQPAPAPAATATKPTEPAAAVPAPAKPVPPKPAQAKPAAAPKPAVAAAPPAPAPVAAPPPPAAASGSKLGPLQEARLVRQFCTVDFQVLCKGVPLGQGRAINCLAANQPALSPNCKQAMATVGR